MTLEGHCQSRELQDMAMLSLRVSYGFVRDTGKVLALLEQV